MDTGFGVDFIAQLRPVVIIPARAGSKGIPGKNLMEIAGKTLLQWAVDVATPVVGHDRVIVSSDGDAILREADRLGVVAHRRSRKNSGDKASSESALLEVLEYLKGGTLEIDNLIFMQCTSPCILPEDLEGLMSVFVKRKLDSAFTATPSHAFLWRESDAGLAEPVNHEMSVRPLRQDRVPEYRENGAAYLMSVSGFMANKHRFFGRCGLYSMPQSRSHEIDSTTDARIVEQYLKERQASLGEFAGRCRAIVFDFDGVLTDNAVTVDESGGESVRCDRRDGFGFELARQFNLRTLILSKERNKVVRKRAEKLKCEVIHGVDRKESVLTQWLQDNEIDWCEIAYVGNDINDLSCINRAGLGVAVADALAPVLEAADLVLRAKGGHAAAREVIDLLLSQRENS